MSWVTRSASVASDEWDALVERHWIHGRECRGLVCPGRKRAAGRRVTRKDIGPQAIAKSPIYEGAGTANAADGPLTAACNAPRG